MYILFYNHRCIFKRCYYASPFGWNQKPYLNDSISACQGHPRACAGYPMACSYIPGPFGYSLSTLWSLQKCSISNSSGARDPSNSESVLSPETLGVIARGTPEVWKLQARHEWLCLSLFACLILMHTIRNYKGIYRTMGIEDQRNVSSLCS